MLRDSRELRAHWFRPGRKVETRRSLRDYADKMCRGLRPISAGSLDAALPRDRRRNAEGRNDQQILGWRLAQQFRAACPSSSPRPCGALGANHAAVSRSSQHDVRARLLRCTARAARLLPRGCRRPQLAHRSLRQRQGSGVANERERRLESAGASKHRAELARDDANAAFEFGLERHRASDDVSASDLKNEASVPSQVSKPGWLDESMLTVAERSQRKLRLAAAAVERGLSDLTASEASLDEQAQKLDAVRASWRALVDVLALGPEPERRACPSCGGPMRLQATRCVYCWKKSSPG